VETDLVTFEQVPASFPQQLLRFFDLVRPGTVRATTFNVMSSYRLRGAIDVDCLPAAADDVDAASAGLA
jgi:hypothetical protein